MRIFSMPNNGEENLQEITTNQLCVFRVLLVNFIVPPTLKTTEKTIFSPPTLFIHKNKKRENSCTSRRPLKYEMSNKEDAPKKQRYLSQNKQNFCSYLYLACEEDTTKRQSTQETRGVIFEGGREAAKKKTRSSRTEQYLEEKKPHKDYCGRLFYLI